MDRFIVSGGLLLLLVGAAVAEHAGPQAAPLPSTAGFARFQASLRPRRRKRPSGHAILPIARPTTTIAMPAPRPWNAGWTGSGACASTGDSLCSTAVSRGVITKHRNDKAWQKNYYASYQQFNPAAFNARVDGDDERAGIKYFSFTSKHHEGFCMWPTKTFQRGFRKKADGTFEEVTITTASLRPLPARHRRRTGQGRQCAWPWGEPLLFPHRLA